MSREPIPDVIADCMLKGCQKGELRAEVERLRLLLRRHYLRGAWWDNDLAVETRAALEPKP